MLDPEPRLDTFFHGGHERHTAQRRCLSQKPWHGARRSRIPELAPAYDIVNTGAWIPGDLPAIPFGPRSWLTPEERYGVRSDRLLSIAPGHKAHHAPLRGGHSGYVPLLKTMRWAFPQVPAPQRLKRILSRRKVGTPRPPRRSRLVS